MLSFLAGCSVFTGDDGRYNPTPLTDYKAGLAARIVWKAQIGSGLGIGFAPAVVGSAVYAAAGDGEAAGGFDVTEAGTRKRLAIHVVADPDEVPGVARLGPDAMSDGLTEEAFAGILAAAGRSQIKGVLRDQSTGSC